ncbi:hypothetical protein Patl1_20867 [Pistacia atlantica]|uniref:Uncharacterized protein n=1 Tax=Pistacia atlantica TaxID=434234 RepID=A0ACC1BNV6_9ROSI|nr:hypothetical protein Patl1_20867 [Pistacia atlantica]
MIPLSAHYGLHLLKDTPPCSTALELLNHYRVPHFFTRALPTCLSSVIDDLPNKPGPHGPLNHPMYLLHQHIIPTPPPKAPRNTTDQPGPSSTPPGPPPNFMMSSSGSNPITDFLTHHTPQTSPQYKIFPIHYTTLEESSSSEDSDETSSIESDSPVVFMNQAYKHLLLLLSPLLKILLNLWTPLNLPIHLFPYPQTQYTPPFFRALVQS